jgi:serine/threonine protein kinase/tetratricopeptide (TPR) repeat protein
MGTVHLAKDRLDGLVALKRLAVANDDFEQPQGSFSVASPDLDTPAFPSSRLASPDAVTMALTTTASASRPSASTAVASTMFHVGAAGAASGPKPPASFDAVVTTAASETASLYMPKTSDIAGDPMAEMLRLTLAREFRLLSSLRHPNIISVLDYGFDDDLSPYFTMELLEGAETIMSAGAERSLDEKLELVAQMLHALAYLHRRGVIHRDLKPGNVLVVGQHVKVLDFGVSTLRDRATEGGGRIIVGTLAYMAPEVLAGAPASEASDLYAVGTIAYELFAGRHPFDMADLFKLRDQILHRPPDLTPLDPRLAPVVGRLLEKRPGLRPESVDALFTELAVHMGRPLALETAATRESFLQAAQLVGRDDELAELEEMLAAAMGGKGGGVLIGGESGVGKTRLLDEVRAHALVDGMVVLRGQGVSSGGGPYHVFREVLRGMVLRTDLDDFEAGVIEAVVPDIAALLEREVPERAEIDPEAAQARLVGVIEDMFRRQQAPVLVILEDLQWAGSETLRLTGRLAALARELPLVVIGTYRDDERPDLPRELPVMSSLKLKRLTPEGIAALASSMLGEAGRRQDVIDRLTRETEGNPFFLVEVVRALAEDAGALSLVGTEPMPKTLPQGGLHLIVRRRLNQVPRRARPLLDAAAVIGRQIDPALLRRIDPEIDLDAWIRTCANVAVLDFGEGAYRFAHDKLREGLLAALSEQTSRALHRKVAEAIEAEYPDDPEHTNALAHHWALAGDAEKEARYSALAGEQALQSSAYREAVELLERAIELVSAAESAEGRGLRAAGRSLLGRARAALRPIVPALGTPVSRESARFRLGLWEGRLSEAYGRMANHAESFRRGERALAYLGHPMPAGRAAFIAGLPVQATLRGLMTLWPSAFAESSNDARTVLLEATRIQTRVTEACFYTQDSLPLFWSGISTLNLGEPAGPSASLACGYALMGAVAGIVPFPPAAEAWCRRAVELVESVGKPYDIAFVAQRVSAYRQWTGDWDVAEAGFQRAMEIAGRVGDQRMRGDAWSSLVFGLLFQGKFERAARVCAEMIAWGQRGSDPDFASGSRVIEAAIEARGLGDLARAAALCREVEPAINAAAVSHGTIRCYGVLALALVLSGQLDEGRRALDRALEELGKTRPTAYWTHDGIDGAAEAALTLWERTGSREDAARARRACKAASAFAFIFPIGRPSSHLWRGIELQLSGEHDKARKSWQTAIEEAERLRMPYQRARALLELGRHLPVGDPERARFLSRAEAIFADIGARLDRNRALGEIRKG